MLKTLNSIDWAHIQHAHGTAEDLPKWFRALRSDVFEIREAARGQLFECSSHLGNVYQVTPYIVPFLIELVAAPDTLDKAPLLNHLAKLASDCRAIAKSGRAGTDEAATYHNIAAGLDTYLALLDDPDPEVPFAAFTLVVALGDAGPLWRIVACLLDAASREKDADHLAEMIRMLAHYVYMSMPNGPSDAFARQMAPLMEFLTAQLAPDRAPRVQFQAALAHLTLIGGAQSDALVDLAWVLGDVLAHPEKYSPEMSSFRIENEIKAALNGIEYFPRAWRMAILAEALPQAQYAGDAHLIGYALLETIFFGTVRTNEIDRKHMRPFLLRARLNDKDSAERPENSTKLFRMDIREQSGQLKPPGRRYVAQPLPADLVALSATERRMLRVVLDTEMVWMLHSNLLAVYGLPVERDAVRALLDEADAANAGA